MARIPYPDLSGAQLEAAAAVREARDGQLPNLFRMLVHSPAVARAWLELGTALRHRTALPAAIRELAVCAVAVRTASRYVWHHHSVLARKAGVADDELRSLQRRDDDRDILEPSRRAAVAYASAVAGGVVSEGHLTAVTSVLNQDQVVELTALAAYYTGAARLLDALQIDIEAIE